MKRSELRKMVREELQREAMSSPSAKKDLDRMAVAMQNMGKAIQTNLARNGAVELSVVAQDLERWLSTIKKLG